MNKLLALIAGCVASLALFVAVFSVVHRPLVVGEIQRQLDHKLGYARTLGSPKLVVFAGSNGRYSHRCEELTAGTGLPCVNASIGVGIGLDFLLDQWRPLLHAGDRVYMPLEYAQYGVDTAEMHGGLQNALLVHSRRDYLRSLGPRRVIDAYGSFDLRFLVHGLVEMVLERRGFQRRSSTASLTPQGDESGHTAELGQAYASFLRDAVFGVIEIPAASDALDVLGAFLRSARAADITVIGGLPTVPDSVVLPPAIVERLRALYESQGQQFVVLPQRSQYPLACFYDTLYHLNERCQRQHSHALGEALARLPANPAHVLEARR